MSKEGEACGSLRGSFLIKSIDLSTFPFSSSLLPTSDERRSTHPSSYTQFIFPKTILLPVYRPYFAIAQTESDRGVAQLFRLDNTC